MPLCPVPTYAYAHLPSCALQDLPDPVLPADVTAAFDVAYANIHRFHSAQASAPLEVETMPGVVCRWGVWWTQAYFMHVF